MIFSYALNNLIAGYILRKLIESYFTIWIIREYISPFISSLMIYIPFGNESASKSSE
jgi:hypothetical protein